jgi:hypothetical protein
VFPRGDTDITKQDPGDSTIPEKASSVCGAHLGYARMHYIPEPHISNRRAGLPYFVSSANMRFSNRPCDKEIA